MGWDGTGLDAGMGRDGMGWDAGMGWDWIGWDAGMGWDRMGCWDGVGLDWMGCWDGAGWDGMGCWDGVGWDGMGCWDGVGCTRIPEGADVAQIHHEDARVLWRAKIPQDDAIGFPPRVDSRQQRGTDRDRCGQLVQHNAAVPRDTLGDERRVVNEVDFDRAVLKTRHRRARAKEIVDGGVRVRRVGERIVGGRSGDEEAAEDEAGGARLGRRLRRGCDPVTELGLGAAGRVQVIEP